MIDGFNYNFGLQKNYIIVGSGKSKPMSGPKTNKKIFLRIKKDSRFCKMDFEHFDIYMDEKYILTYTLSFKKYHVGSNSFKPDSGQKITHFNFMKMKIL